MRAILTLVACALASPPAWADSYAFTQAGNSLTFHNAASLHEFDGEAKVFAGKLDTTAGTGSLTVYTANMTTHLGPRDKKMRNFCLEVKQFPKIVLDITTIGLDVEGLASGEGEGKVLLAGTMTIRSVNRQVRIPADYQFTEAGLQLSGSYPMLWTDFEVPDPSILISTLYPEMTVSFNVRLEVLAPEEGAEEAE